MTRRALVLTGHCCYAVHKADQCCKYLEPLMVTLIYCHDFATCLIINTHLKLVPCKGRGLDCPVAAFELH